MSSTKKRKADGEAPSAQPAKKKPGPKTKDFSVGLPKINSLFKRKPAEELHVDVDGDLEMAEEAAVAESVGFKATGGDAATIEAAAAA